MRQPKLTHEKHKPRLSPNKLKCEKDIIEISQSIALRDLRFYHKYYAIDKRKNARAQAGIKTPL